MDKADYVAIQDAVQRYPRHVEGRIIQQGGLSFLHSNEHRWYLPLEVAMGLGAKPQEKGVWRRR